MKSYYVTEAELWLVPFIVRCSQSKLLINYIKFSAKFDLIHKTEFCK